MSTAGAALAVPPPLTLHGGSSQSVTLTANSAAGPGASTQSLRAALRTRDLRFWLVFVAITVSTFLSAIDTTSVSTALPTITHSLGQTRPLAHDGSNIADPLLSWVGSAFALGATAVLPLSGKLAEVFGRRPVLMWALVVFAAGSALCGAAPSASVLIVGRVVQGMGSAAIQVLCSIIISDLVPLRERGFFQGIVGATWSVAAAAGPCLGGAFSQAVSWRWLFYINLPLCGVALILVFIFLDLRMPTDSVRSRLLRMDWAGNFLIIASSTSCMIALSWAGFLYQWQDYHVLVPLCLGIVGLVAAFVIEGKYAKEPTIPFDILSNWTSASAYFSAFIHYVVLINAAYFIPVYLQAVKGRSPLRAGLDILPLATCISPAGILAGIHISKMDKYVLYNVAGFALITTGVGLLSSTGVYTAWGLLYLYEIISAAGYGVVESAGMTAVLAPLAQDSSRVPAQALLLFIRTIAQTWGLTVGSTVLQNQLRHFARPGLPYFGPSTIPDMSSFPPDVQLEMKLAYASSLTTLWRVMIGISGLGLLSLGFMRDIPLHTTVDDKWGLADRPSLAEGGSSGIIRPFRRSGVASGSNSAQNTPATGIVMLPSPTLNGDVELSRLSPASGRAPSSLSPTPTPGCRTISLPPVAQSRPGTGRASAAGSPALGGGSMPPTSPAARMVELAPHTEAIEYPGSGLQLTIEPPEQEEDASTRV